METAERAQSAGLRRILGAIFLVGSLGTAAELLLLEHLEDAWQKAPLVLIAIGCAMLAALAVRPSGLAVRLFQLTMVAFLASGIVGVALHYQGNVEFELELQPDASGFRLFWEARKGATPALAPGTMMLLGVIGLTYTMMRALGESSPGTSSLFQFGSSSVLPMLPPGSSRVRWSFLFIKSVASRSPCRPSRKCPSEAPVRSGQAR